MKYIEASLKVGSHYQYYLQYLQGRLVIYVTGCAGQ